MTIVCFGDSLTSCGGENGRFSDVLQRRFPDHRFINRSASGETIADGLRRLHADVLADAPDIVLVELGANDWHRNERPPEKWARDLEQIVSRIRAAGATPVILGVFGDCRDDAGTPTPKTEGTDERGRRFQRLEQDVATRCGCPYVPNIQERIMGNRCCWDASGHPNAYGNRLVADAVEPVLETLLREKALPACRAPSTTRDMWTDAVHDAPGTLAFVDGERRVTYAEADLSVRRIAAGLQRESGMPSPTVAASLNNSLEYCLLYWAMALTGGTIVPLNTWLKSRDLAGILAHVKSDVLVARSVRDEAVTAIPDVRPRRIVLLDAEASDATPWERLLKRDTEPELPGIGTDALAIIMHTSGTTGTPKGVVMHQSDLMFNVVAAINANDYGVRDVNLFTSPMFHCGPFYTFLPTAAWTKATLVLASPTRPAELIEAVLREGVTTITTAPSVVRQILKHVEQTPRGLPSLRLIAYAGSPMDARSIRRLRRHFPSVALHNFFGLTETTSMTHVLRDADADIRPESIGRLLPHVDAMVVNETLCPCPPKQPGELLIARENVTRGYYGQPGRLEESVARIDGREWFRTGDGAAVDADGYFVLEGRKKDMIIVGGENVYAQEIESFLMEHEGVSEAAVKGVPAAGARAFLGEQIVAYVVPSDRALTERDLRKHCFERLPSYKVPQRVILMKDLPRNPAGKVVKAELPRV